MHRGTRSAAPAESIASSQAEDEDDDEDEVEEQIILDMPGGMPDLDNPVSTALSAIDDGR